MAVGFLDVDEDDEDVVDEVDVDDDVDEVEEKHGDVGIEQV